MKANHDSVIGRNESITMTKRHREEAEKIRLEKERTRAYKESLIQDILAKGLNHNQYTEEQLRGKSIRVLEMMW